MVKGKIILQPMGGLANRMRIIAVLYELSKLANADFEVWWAANNDLGARWSDLFQKPSFKIVELSGAYYHAHKYKKWYKRLPHVLWCYWHGYSWLSYDDVYALTLADTPENAASIRQNWIKRLETGETLFISSGDNLGPVTNLTIFQPIASIVQQVNEFMTLKSVDWAHLYGMHIRRTDNTWAIKNSPITMFENKIEEIVANEPTAKFYLATDDENTISYLNNRFQNSMVIRKKDFSRSSIVGIQDALIDILLLSKTKKIYGSYFSSFSEMASWLGNIELVVLKTNA